ncbi:MAG: polysaccharide biosynthesis protein [Roseburia sp.]|nr:polysaccharide biosynthesis protein [Roseburia sp.]MCM1099370.1 polysaccharide biosynthesis protein [Ruminococcus flavefaciens]
MKSAKKHPLVTGTVILTLTGLLSRVIGFFYRIYLSRLFGEEGMGLYQLLSPVLSLSFALTAAGYQTAISKLVAEQSALRKTPSLRPLWAGMRISLPLSLLCNAFVYLFADFIASSLLQEPRTAPMLRILSFSIPLSAVHACVNGYFYGVKRAGIPAVSQLLEQLTRVGCVYLLSARALASGSAPSINAAVLGLTVGEFFSMLYSAAVIPRRSKEKRFTASRFSPLPTVSPKRQPVISKPNSEKEPPVSSDLYRGLLAMALPLTANRIVLNLLQSVESVSIPSMLRLYGYDNTTALSVYGVLTGMAMPFIFFPNALTSSVAVLLLPVISENYALGNFASVRQATVKTVKYCGFLGICCMAGFVGLGSWAGNTLFHSPLAGYFISTLGFICPFLYLDTTLSSILQGLGKAGHIFVLNVLCLLLRLGFVFLAVPRFGITGYLWGLLASQLTLGVLYLTCLGRLLKKMPPPAT